MSNLTTFSKTLIVLAIVGFFAVLIGGCFACSDGCNRQNYNQGYNQQPVYQEQPTVITVQQPDGSSFLMNYLLYRSLMDQGGPTQVNNYYNSNRSSEEFQSQRQEQYRQTYQKEEQVRTQKSSGFGTKSTQTTTSNGFGNRPVETNKSTGFGSSNSTKSSGGFGSSSGSSSTNKSSVSTKSSSGFGTRSTSTPASKKSTTTSRSSGFGKRN